MLENRAVQNYWRVARAETAREMRLPARWILLGVACGAGLLAGLGIVAIINGSAGGDLVGGAGGGTLPVQVSASIVALVLAIGFMAATTGSTTDGTVTTSMILVPRTRRLLLARAVLPPLVGAAATLAVGLLVALVQLVTGGAGSAAAGLQMVAVGASTVAVALLLLLVFLGATVMRRGAYAVAAFLLVVLVLPLAAAIAIFVGPPVVAEMAQVVIDVTPGTLVVSALSVPFADGETWGTVLRGFAGLLVWCAVLLPVALWQFRREGDRAD